MWVPGMPRTGAGAGGGRGWGFAEHIPGVSGSHPASTPPGRYSSTHVPVRPEPRQAGSSALLLKRCSQKPLLESWQLWALPTHVTLLPHYSPLTPQCPSFSLTSVGHRGLEGWDCPAKSGPRRLRALLCLRLWAGLAAAITRSPRPGRGRPCPEGRQGGAPQPGRPSRSLPSALGVSILAGCRRPGPHFRGESQRWDRGGWEPSK